MSRIGSIPGRLYRGELSIDFIGRRKLWYLISGSILLISIGSLAIRGLNPSIDFKGGAVFSFPAHGHSQQYARSAFESVGITPEIVQSTGAGKDLRVETQTLNTGDVSKVEDVLNKRFDVKRGDINVDTVGASWGSQVTNKALLSLVVFLIAVILYLSMRYDWKMALAAIVALLHDLLLTAGIYSLSGFEVSPDTVIALLTVLGYSLYDTVVVFDKVRENTVGLAGGSRMTYSQAANLGVNQTLMRSINTSIIALLPVAGLLGIGSGLLGAGSLEDLSLALLIGLAAGAYSSIFIATPLLCDMKEREPQFKALARRVASRQAKDSQRDDEPVTTGVAEAAAVAAPAAGAAMTYDGGGAFPDRPVSAPPRASRPAGPGSRQRSKRRGGKKRNR